jgi:hypothetical protein
MLRHPVMVRPCVVFHQIIVLKYDICSKNRLAVLEGLEILLAFVNLFCLMSMLDLVSFRKYRLRTMTIWFIYFFSWLDLQMEVFKMDEQGCKETVSFEPKWYGQGQRWWTLSNIRPCKYYRFPSHIPSLGAMLKH